MSEPFYPTLEELARMLRPPKLAYCDYIANRIKVEMERSNGERFIASVGFVKSDLHPKDGYLLTTKKTLEVTDFQGKIYRVTVEEIDGPEAKLFEAKEEV